MKKSILNIGKALNRTEQKSINGSGGGSCSYDGQPCGRNYFCCEDPASPGSFVCLHWTLSCHSSGGGGDQ
ncbi:MAG: hypothetical protein JXR05_05845 [Flavobacteriaceae bacterium]